ncbi:excinuclease ATPase subunit [Gilvimarinus agarilyticus]|uniref:excinuclease ATPase subunit n=1 Tax=unclassified Gilvimarinus TaxID=2642066 RepID=UPI001C0881ED|nr:MULTISPECIES: excinuclease ATPase subunit [unclassified Gilvimarinus]MBU2886436.1 excinuclease ATPase subunit [Gilvimarinus agarilyticus]MDO6571115.1 excinuclease ATPase subunit [Gilvimarinus sp. 2_MG-2023]MDO6745659.1 excinuclease ATPase subunit [Gilvimarinus sp. 1_MG-2023]
MAIRLNKTLSLIAAAALTFGAVNAQARDEGLMLPIQDVLTEYTDKLDSDIKLYFGEQAYPAPSKKLGSFTSNKKTKAVFKSDEEACSWAMLSALIALQERAVREGGNAVVDIVSYYKKNEMSSETQYECHAGKIMAGVAMRGRVVTID